VGEVEGLPGDLDLDKEGSKKKELIKLSFFVRTLGK
jgi:hypothetical protein